MAALLTVALGIGVNAVVFSLFDRVLFRPLPYGEPDRLVQLQSHLSSTGAGEPRMRYAIALALAREAGLFSGIGWARGGDLEPMTPAAGGNPLLWLTGVTTNALDVLGIQPVIGAGLSAFPATTLERPRLLTYDVWQHRYGASDDVLSLAWTTRDAGQRDVHWRVVGVLPREFLLPSPRLATAQFDGIYGVLAGLEALEAIDEAGVETRRSIEVVAWTNEEGGRFQPCTMGSSVFTGACRLEDFLDVRDNDGVVLRDAFQRKL